MHRILVAFTGVVLATLLFGTSAKADSTVVQTTTVTSTSTVLLPLVRNDIQAEGAVASNVSGGCSFCVWITSVLGPPTWYFGTYCEGCFDFGGVWRVWIPVYDPDFQIDEGNIFFRSRSMAGHTDLYLVEGDQLRAPPYIDTQTRGFPHAVLLLDSVWAQENIEKGTDEAGRYFLAEDQ